MLSAKSIVADLKKKGREKTRIIYSHHGIPAERAFGVSIADLKGVAKTIKGQQALACELYETGMLEAMCLAGMVARGPEAKNNTVLTKCLVRTERGRSIRRRTQV